MGCLSSIPTSIDQGINKFYIKNVKRCNYYGTDKAIGTKLYYAIRDCNLTEINMLLNREDIVVNIPFGYINYGYGYCTDYNNIDSFIFTDKLCRFAPLLFKKGYPINLTTILHNLSEIKNKTILKECISSLGSRLPNYFMRNNINFLAKFDLKEEFTKILQTGDSNFMIKNIHNVVKFDLKEEFIKILQMCESDNKKISEFILTLYKNNSWYFNEIVNNNLNKFTISEKYKDENGNTLLNLTLYNNDTEIAHKLIDKIDDRNILTYLNNNNENAVMIASKMMMFDTIKKIKERILKLS